LDAVICDAHSHFFVNVNKEKFLTSFKQAQRQILAMQAYGTVLAQLTAGYTQFEQTVNANCKHIFH